MNSYKALMKKEIRQTGFTLVELLVVIVVIVITLAIAIPSAKSLIERKRVTEAIEGLVSAIYVARSESSARSTALRMEIDLMLSGGVAFGITEQPDPLTSKACDPDSGTACQLTATTGVLSYDRSYDEIFYRNNQNASEVSFDFDPFTSVVQGYTLASNWSSSPVTAIYIATTNNASDDNFYCKRISIGYLGQVNVDNSCDASKFSG